MNLFFKRIFPADTERGKSSEVVDRPDPLYMRFHVITKFRRIVILILFLFYAGKVVAPDHRSILIADTPPIEPFTSLISAIGMVESGGDTLAYNELEKAVGFFQIRQVRLDDYNKRTGNKFRLIDMYDYGKAEKVFMFYASKLGPYNFEKIAKNWNGSGPLTISYWKRVKKHL
jgi:hypothetical protein